MARTGREILLDRLRAEISEWQIQGINDLDQERLQKLLQLALILAEKAHFFRNRLKSFGESVPALKDLFHAPELDLKLFEEDVQVFRKQVRALQAAAVRAPTSGPHRRA